MTFRFVEADEKFIEELKNTTENKTQKEEQTTGVTFFNNGQRREEKMSNLKAVKYHSLTKLQPNVLPSWRREVSGKEYEPDSLNAMRAALDRYLRSQNYPKSIVRVTELLLSRKVLEGKARKLRELRTRKQPSKAQSLTKEEEEN